MTAKKNNRQTAVLDILHPRFKISGIYAITSEGEVDFHHTQSLLRSGVRILQYRAKNTAPADRYRCAEALLVLCKQYQTLLIINDDVELAQKIGAHGVHLGENDTTINHARDWLGTDKLIGISCYNRLKYAIEAEKAGADYVAFGSIFTSSTKPNAPRCTLRMIRQARAQLSIPIVAIGGITLANKHLVLNAGAHAVAMINALKPQHKQ